MVLLDKLAGRRVVASISGGKDSAALSLWLTEQGIEHDRVFADTGWEHPVTYEYLRGPLTKALGPISEVRAAESLPDMARRKGIFPSRRKRWCSEHLKLFPIKGYLEDVKDRGDEPVNAVGIRAEESRRRADMPEWEWSKEYDCEVWRPLIAWTFEDVRDIHARHGLRPNPLYLAGAERVGCFPCIHAGKGEVALMARIWPARIEEIRALEAQVTARAREIVSARGEELIHPRTLLRERRPGAASNIDEQVRWAQSGEPDLLATLEEPGCARWALCDTGGSRGEVP